MTTYKVGDVIRYRTFDGSLREVTVTERDPDVKNGYAGFIGTNGDGEFWGYDDQIVRVVK